MPLGACHISVPGLKSATTKQVSRHTIHTKHSWTAYSKHHVSAKLKSLVDDGSILLTTVMSQTPSIYERTLLQSGVVTMQLTVQVDITDIATF